MVQSGLITDKSKELRIAIDSLIKNENLSNIPVEIVKSEISDDESFSKIIKIMIQMPIIGDGINNIDAINNNTYAWTTSNINKEDYELIKDSKIFYPWKLIKRK